MTKSVDISNPTGIELTVWITPFTTLQSLDDAIAHVQQLAAQYNSFGNLLLPVAYGNLPQSQVRQTLPAEMCVSGPSDVPGIRQRVEATGLGFGVWVVPIDPTCAPYHAGFGDVGGYLAVNFEGTPDFWTAGDNAGAIDAYWGSLWNSFADQVGMNGNVAATMVPTSGEQLNWSTASLQALSGGANELLLEVYGGPNTAYRYPNDWPDPSVADVAALLPNVTLAPILALANLDVQFQDAVGLGNGNVHVWAE